MTYLDRVREEAERERQQALVTSHDASGSAASRGVITPDHLAGFPSSQPSKQQALPLTPASQELRALLVPRTGNGVSSSSPQQSASRTWEYALGLTARLDWQERQVPRRFACKFIEADGCWQWMGAQNGNGYGRLRVDGRAALAHRVAYEVLVGPIPEGLQTDHTCRNRGCVNPDHLEPVTQRENILRGEGLPAQNAAKTTCPLGHPYQGENLYLSPRGDRQCRTCKRERRRSATSRGMLW